MLRSEVRIVGVPLVRTVALGYTWDLDNHRTGVLGGCIFSLPMVLLLGFAWRRHVHVKGLGNV